MGRGKLIIPSAREQKELFNVEKFGHSAGIIGSAKSCEQYTPRAIWEPGLKLFGVGRYDLNPATWDGSPIPTWQHYTRKEDGLSMPWICDNLWSNFPYSDINPENGKKMIVMSKWIAKLCDEFECGNVGEALTLVKSDCRPEWFHQLLEASSAHLFIKGGVKFESPTQENGTSFFGSILFYLGPNGLKFKDCYQHLGIVGCVL